MILRMLTAVCFLTLLSACKPAALEEVLSGEAQLYCHLPEGWKQINKERVVDIVDGTWIFDNGQAKACKLIKGK